MRVRAIGIALSVLAVTILTGTPPAAAVSGLAPATQLVSGLVDEALASAPVDPADPIGVITYEAAGLPEGFTFDPLTRIVSGSSTVPVSADVTITATDDLGDALAGTAVASATVSIVVAAPPDPPTLTASPSLTVTGTVGTPIAPTTFVATGLGVDVSYAAATLLPDFALDPVTGVLSGTPTAASTGTFDVVATGSTGTLTVTLTITIVAASLLPLTAEIVGRTGTAIEPVTFTTEGFTGPLVYTAVPALPQGLEVDPLTGILAGTPEKASARRVHELTATDAGGATATAEVTVEVTGVLTPAESTLVGEVGSIMVPSAGYAVPGLTALGLVEPIVFTVRPGLPPGMSINSGTGVIYGRPTAAGSGTLVDVIATDSNGAVATGAVSFDVAKGRLLAPLVYSVQPGAEPGSLRVLFTGSSNAPPGQVYAADVFEAGSSTLARTVRPVTSFMVIDGLVPGGNYDVVIVADGSADYLEARSPRRPGRAALADAGLSLPIITAISGGSTPGSIKVTFTKPPGAPAAQMFSALVFATDQTSLVRSVPKVSSPVTITGLVPGTTYYVVIVAEPLAGVAAQAVSPGRLAVATRSTGGVAATDVSAAGFIPLAGSVGVRLGAGWHAAPGRSGCLGPACHREGRPLGPRRRGTGRPGGSWARRGAAAHRTATLGARRSRPARAAVVDRGRHGSGQCAGDRRPARAASDAGRQLPAPPAVGDRPGDLPEGKGCARKVKRSLTEADSQCRISEPLRPSVSVLPD